MSKAQAKAKVAEGFYTNGTGSITGASAQTAMNGMVDVLYADFPTRASSPTTGDLAQVDSNGDLVDSGILGTSVSGHIASTSNPHSVTKAQVGLGNVDNTADADKPVSTAMQTALNAKATTAALTTHTSDTSNPHSVTKSQVGLGNCDNTSDADKPISTATQTALDAKATTTALTAHTSDTDNPHSVTKAQLGLGNVDNTSDANKPVSTATQELVYPIEADVDSLIDNQVAEINFASLPIMCGQPMILFGNGTPAEATVPDNWRQFADGGYQWNGLPSALGQQYVNYAVNTGGHYIAVKDGDYALKWLNM